MESHDGGAHPDDDEEFCPPDNFALIEKGIYRSAFPMKRNFTFLARIRLRSILTLILEEYPAANVEFNEKHGIKLFQYGMEGNKEPFRSMPVGGCSQVLREVMNPRNHPILIHCNEGKHRTGVIVSLLRRYRGWALSSTLDEYLLYAQPKARAADQRFIEMFDCDLVDTQTTGKKKNTEEPLASTTTLPTDKPPMLCTSEMGTFKDGTSDSGVDVVSRVEGRTVG